LREVGLDCVEAGKNADDPDSAITLIEQGAVDLVINVPRSYDSLGRPDGYQIRRQAIDTGIGLITDRQLARAVVEALRWMNGRPLELVSWNEQVANRRMG
jgi:hypothetical protein